ncbi:hypothetical protein [Sulfurimonas sp.]|uniref:hypothetical protein n=1 Tax=Sulfurimonas sp. TaxID=2022749 RepID=UPI0026108AF1|nr:hypothetical protein [Sulfurimonas sp.]
MRFKTQIKKVEYNLAMNLQDLKDKTILFLGKSRAFSEEEFASQLEFHHISVTQEINDTVSLIVEGRMMTPYEQNLSEELYALEKYEFMQVAAFEGMLASEIDNDTLLMSLKLSHDKKRLKSFLQNPMIADELFFKLLKMYSWNKEDFFENDDNRDVTAAFISRFYENIERNHNVQYATTGLFHLVSQTKNEELLEAIALLEPTKMHPKLIQALARHEKIPKRVLKKYIKEDNFVAKEAMAYNAKIDKSIIKELAKSQDLLEVLAKNVQLDAEIFALLFEYKTLLASNESLTNEMQKELFSLNNAEVNTILAKNPSLNESLRLELLKLNNAELNAAIYTNPSISKEMLCDAYEDENNHLSLAKNPATPPKLLEAMFHTADEKILDALARNESTPVEVLYQLQLDSRFDRAVKTNAAFGKHIQSENIGWLV